LVELGAIMGLPRHIMDWYLGHSSMDWYCASSWIDIVSHSMDLCYLKVDTCIASFEKMLCTSNA
jgi:hypothetical protein